MLYNMTGKYLIPLREEKMTILYLLHPCKTIEIETYDF